MSRRFWGVQNSSEIMFGAVEGEGWAGPCMLDFRQNFDFPTRPAIVCTMAERQSCDTCCALMGLVCTEHAHFVQNYNRNITVEVLAFIATVETLSKEIIKQH